MNQVTIGVLLDTDFDYGVGVLEGIREAARSRPDWRVLPVPYAQESLLTRLVRTGELHGVVGAFISDRWIESRLPSDLPAVNTANLSQITRVCSVVADDAAAGRLVARHFHDLGYRRAGVIADRATYASHVRREGFLTALAEQGMTALEPASEASFRYESGWLAWIIGLEPDTPVFCTSDHLARRFRELCRQSKDPDLAKRPTLLAGIGDSLADRVLSGVDLTSVALPSRAVGLRAAARLACQMAGDRAVVRECAGAGELIVRGSTARFASPDAVVARALGLALQTLAQNPGVDEIARRVGVSRRTLELRFRAAFGKGPADIFRARRLELARRLLAETELSVAEVAARTGNSSVQSFTTLFHRTFGLPPAEYRRRMSADTPPISPTNASTTSASR